MAKTETPSSAIVAARKSVDVDGVLFGPGKTVTLAASDVISLRAKGFLENPDGDDFDAPSSGGVTITGDSGAQ
nr:hypothetical protein [uncultured Duganella sp.]